MCFTGFKLPRNLLADDSGILKLSWSCRSKGYQTSTAGIKHPEVGFLWMYRYISSGFYNLEWLCVVFPLGLPFIQDLLKGWMQQRGLGNRGWSLRGSEEGQETVICCSTDTRFLVLMFSEWYFSNIVIPAIVLFVYQIKNKTTQYPFQSLIFITCLLLHWQHFNGVIAELIPSHDTVE